MVKIKIRNLNKNSKKQERNPKNKIAAKKSAGKPQYPSWLSFYAEVRTYFEGTNSKKNA